MHGRTEPTLALNFPAKTGLTPVSMGAAPPDGSILRSLTSLSTPWRVFTAIVATICLPSLVAPSSITCASSFFAASTKASATASKFEGEGLSEPIAITAEPPPSDSPIAAAPVATSAARAALSEKARTDCISRGPPRSSTLREAFPPTPPGSPRRAPSSCSWTVPRCPEP